MAVKKDELVSKYAGYFNFKDQECKKIFIYLIRLDKYYFVFN